MAMCLRRAYSVCWAFVCVCVLHKMECELGQRHVAFVQRCTVAFGNILWNCLFGRGAYFWSAQTKLLISTRVHEHSWSRSHMRVTYPMYHCHSGSNQSTMTNYTTSNIQFCFASPNQRQDKHEHHNEIASIQIFIFSCWPILNCFVNIVFVNAVKPIHCRT